MSVSCTYNRILERSVLNVEFFHSLLLILYCFMDYNFFFGILILMVGNYVSNLSANAIAAGENKGFASFARVGVLSIFIPIALSTMGMATNIVNLAFGLILGAVAVAFALAFGLGGREVAGKELENFFQKLRNK